MELVNHLYHFKEWKEKQNEIDSASVIRESLEALILTLWPFAPHIAEEMATLLNFLEPEKSWPIYNEELTKTDEILIVLQVNGKVRQKLQIEVGISDEDLKSLALSDPKILEWTQDKEVKKVIIVPKKLVNIVVK
jgi:leucyl-tRNA synthetase